MPLSLSSSSSSLSLSTSLSLLLSLSSRLVCLFVTFWKQKLGRLFCRAGMTRINNPRWHTSGLKCSFNFHFVSNIFYRVKNLFWLSCFKFNTDWRFQVKDNSHPYSLWAKYLFRANWCLKLCLSFGCTDINSKRLHSSITRHRAQS